MRYVLAVLMLPVSVPVLAVRFLRSMLVNGYYCAMMEVFGYRP